MQQQDNEIDIYSRTVSDSAYNEIKATVLINAPMTQVAVLMGDGDGCTAWRANCKSSELIETVSEHERYVYAVLDLPWPVADRDMVLHSITEIDEQTKTATVYLQSDSSHYPAGDYVRAEVSGRFVIRAVNDKQVEFTYIMHTELGGNLPTRLVNNGLVASAFDELSRLRQLAER